MAVTFTCAGHPEINQIQPGSCPDGKATIKTRTLRPHGNHNPQYGGQFFMAPDNTHHLEGAFPRARLFRLYLYDDYARPLPPDRMKAVKARVVTKETFDTATRTTKEIAAFPLVRRGGGYLEARVDTAEASGAIDGEGQVQERRAGIPFRFHVHRAVEETGAAGRRVAPRAGRVERPRADEPGRAGRVRPPRAAASAAATPAPAAPATVCPTPVRRPDPRSAGRAGLVPVPIPDSVPEIVAQLKTRHQEIGELVERGAFGAVWVPAFQARDLSIALEARLGELPAAAREAAEPAIKRLVRTAWLLDAFGDVGNRQQIVDAYAIFGAAVDEVVAAFK